MGVQCLRLTNIISHEISLAPFSIFLLATMVTILYIIGTLACIGPCTKRSMLNKYIPTSTHHSNNPIFCGTFLLRMFCLVVGRCTMVHLTSCHHWRMMCHGMTNMSLRLIQMIRICDYFYESPQKVLPTCMQIDFVL